MQLGRLVDGLRVVEDGPQARRSHRRQRPAARAARRAGRRRRPCRWKRRGAGAARARRARRGEVTPMNFSHFFIDRPIFAAVLSIVIFIAGADRDARSCRSASIPKSCRRRSSCARRIPAPTRRSSPRPSPRRSSRQINGVEDMLYMSSQATTDGVHDADRHLQARHRSRQRAGAGAEPRRAGAAAAAGGSAPPRRHHAEELARPHDGRAPGLAGRAATTMLYLRNYATLQVKDELARIPGVGRGAGVRRRRLRDARLARPGRSSPRAT